MYHFSTPLYRFFLFPLLCFLLCRPLSAQKLNTDSLVQVLETGLDTAKVDAAVALGWAFYSSAPDKTLLYGQKALLISTKLNDKTRRATALNIIGLAHDMQGRFDSAVFYYEQTLRQYEELENKKGVANSYNNLGIVYDLMGNNELSLINYFSALRIYDDIGNEKDVADANNNIGLIYAKLRDTDKALEFYGKAIRQYKKLDDLYGIAASYTNIGEIMEDLKDLDSCLVLYKKTIPIREEINDLYGLADTYNNIAGVYGLRNKNDESLKYYLKALDLKKEIGDGHGVLSILTNLAYVYRDLGNTDKAEKALEQALEMSDAMKSLTRKMYVYRSFSELREAQGRLSEALTFYKQYKLLNDSIYDTDRSKKVAELEEQYETEKKDKQIELMRKDQELRQSEIKRKNQVLIGAFCGLGLVLFLSGFLYRSVRQKNRANKRLEEQQLLVRQKNAVLEEQKEKMQKQSENLQEANIAITKQRDDIEQKNRYITKGIRSAERIQQALISSEERLRTCFPESFVIFKPRDIVSGDFMWLGENQENSTTVLVVADCTGHGVSGALMTILGANLLEEIVNAKKIDSPSEILYELDRKIWEVTHRESRRVNDGMDVSILTFNRSDKQILFSGAKNPLFHFRKGVFTQTKGSKFPVGGKRFKQEKVFSNTVINAEEGDRFFMFSDGFKDQFGGLGDRKFMARRFREMIVENHRLSFEAQKTLYEETLCAWQGKKPQTDDILFVGLEV